MEAWQTILLAFGGNAVLLAILGWLAKSFVEGRLAKEVERFRSELRNASVEHQVRFSKLHEKRAKVIAELYGHLADMYAAASSLADMVEFSGEPSKTEQYATAMNKMRDFYLYFDKNRIYLPQTLCDSLEQFARDIQKDTVGLGVHFSFENSSPDVIQKKLQLWQTVWQKFKEVYPGARSALEHEFRAILGAI